MHPTPSSYFRVARPLFASERIKRQVIEWVRALPEEPEILRRRWMGALWKAKLLPPQTTVRFIDEVIGFGLFAEEEIPEGAFIGEYTGMVKKRPLLRTRRNHYAGEYTLPGVPVRFIIDAAEYGSDIRFANHSFAPNCQPVTVVIEGILRVLNFATKPIAKGEQITMDYGPAFWKWRRPPREI